MTREEAIKFWEFRYENAKDYTDPNWEAQERKAHREYVEALRMAIEALSAEAEPTVIRCKTLLNAEDFEAVATRIRKENRNVIVIPCETEVASAEAVQGKESGSKLDLISRASAMGIVEAAISDENISARASLYMARAELSALPSAVCDDCIWTVCNYNKVDWDTPSADAVSREEYEETDGVIEIKKQSAKDVWEIKHIVVCSPNCTRYFYNESMPIPSDEAVQGCDRCRYNTRIPQERCLRCKRYWRDSYERKGGEAK